MISDQLKKMSNPYSITTKLIEKRFVGRTEALDTLAHVLDEYKRSATLKNILISGNRSIGKSTLLNRYRQILEGYDFAVHELELPNPATPINEFQVIKELIDGLFLRYSGQGGHFFDALQEEIWFSLTSDKYDHSSSFIDRELRFASQYANLKRGGEETLSYKDLHHDFSAILNELISHELQIVGLAILIDEFQELARSPLLLDILRMLSENLTGLLIIGAGRSDFLNNRGFEKFCRPASVVELKSMNQSEILELMYRPLEFNGKFSRYDVERSFDPKSVQQVINRTAGNPLHVNIICSKMFERLQGEPAATLMEIDRGVMERVMTYYSTISENSRKIQRALDTCSRDQLEAFGRLYYYEGLSILAAIRCELAFQSIQPTAEEAVRKRFVDDYREISELGFFELSKPTLTISDLESSPIDRLSNLEYSFSGDTIDKLYAAYYYQDLTRQELKHREERRYEDILAYKLAEEINRCVGAVKIPMKDCLVDQLVFVAPRYADGEQWKKDTISDLKALITTEIKDESKDNSAIARVKAISRKHYLDIPTLLTAMFGFEGHYLLITNARIKGKDKTIYSFFPFKGNLDAIVELESEISDYADILKFPLREYNVDIDWMYLRWLPKQPLLTIYLVDINHYIDELYSLVRQHKFEDAVKKAEMIHTLNLKFSDKDMFANVQAYNNYGFCLINVGLHDEAKTVFEELQGQWLISKLNLAYVLFTLGDFTGSESILRKIVKKCQGQGEQANFLHLALKHDRISQTARIVEDVKLFNVAVWNFALLGAQQAKDQAFYRSVLKKAIKQVSPDSFVHRRVLNWIDFYAGHVDVSVQNSTKLLADYKKKDNFRDALLEDLEIFETEAKK